MRIGLYPKYFVKRLFSKAKKGNFFSAGYKFIYPECTKDGMTPWQHYIIDGKRKGYGNGSHPSPDLFFPEGYLAEYPDVANSEIDPWRHYVLYGKKEGRDNGNHPDEKLFCAAGYLEMYPDVVKAGNDPWRHYLLCGKKEGRDNGQHPTEKVFYAAGYLEMYPDVAKAKTDPWQHYLQFGKKEGRDNGLHPGSNEFLPGGYLEMYPDVVKANMDPWRHYLKYGKKEGRDNGLHPDETLFFNKGYLEMYPDVAASGMNPWEHYVRCGKKEGRDNGFHPKESIFCAKNYLEMYLDVAKAKMDPWRHYVLYGKREGRDNGLHPIPIRYYPYLKKELDIDLSDVDLSEKVKIPVFERPLVSIVIPCYNNFDVTMRCLRSVVKNTADVSYEVIIADDHSTDQTKDLEKFVSNARYIVNNKANGFVNNCNSGASIAKGQYIYFLNNDTQVQPGYLSALIDLIDNDPSIGIVGSMFIYPDGTVLEAGGMIYEDCSGDSVGRGLKNIEDVSVNYVRDTDYISGAGLMIRTELFKELNGFDPKYAPAYCEDSDLCLRVWYIKHKRVVFQPKSRVVHFEGQSFPSEEKKALINKNNLTLFHRFFKELCSHHTTSHHISRISRISSPFVFKDHASHKKQMLAIDMKILSPSFDTGSRVTFQYLKLFMQMGMNVKFYPLDIPFERHEFLEDLEQIGVEVIFEEFASYIKRNGKYFDYVFVNRPGVAAKVINLLRLYTRAQIIYQGHDLSYLRHYRENLINKKADAEERMKNERRWEFDIIKACDLPCYVSQDEVDIVNAANPFSHCIKIPIFLFDAEEMVKVYKAGERKNICFVAGFGHKPNIDGACWFVKNVWPLVIKQLPDLKIYIIGSKPSDEVKSLASDSVIVTGYVSDDELSDYYSKVRMAVVPLNYGAGVKGKTVEAIYNKVPVLTTKIGAEGIDNSMGILAVENDADSFAARLIEMYTNEDELQRISDISVDFIREQFTKEKAIEIFDQFLAK